MELAEQSCEPDRRTRPGAGPRQDSVWRHRLPPDREEVKATGLFKRYQHLSHWSKQEPGPWRRRTWLQDQREETVSFRAAAERSERLELCAQIFLNEKPSQRASASLPGTPRGMGSNPHSATETLGRLFHPLGPRFPHL